MIKNISIFIIFLLISMILLSPSANGATTIQIETNFDNNTIQGWQRIGQGVTLTTSAIAYDSSYSLSWSSAVPNSGGTAQYNFTTDGSDLHYSLAVRTTTNNRQNCYVAFSNNNGANNHGLILRFTYTDQKIYYFSGNTSSYISTGITWSVNQWYLIEGIIFSANDYERYSLSINNNSVFRYMYGDASGTGITRLAITSSITAYANTMYVDEVLVYEGDYPYTLDANFTYSPSIGIVTETEFSFIDSSSGNIDNYSWDFGDGNISYSENPTHIYYQTGNYSVSLRVHNSIGYNWENKTDIITILGYGGSSVITDNNAMILILTTGLIMGGMFGLVMFIGAKRK